MTTVKPLVVGAYAALPEERQEQEEFYEQLAVTAGATALEIPFHKVGLNVETDWLAIRMAGRFRESVLTLIPGTMVQVWDTATFGLASTDQEGREAALAFVASARRVAEELNQTTGEQSVSVLHIHSAPSKTAELSAFETSLAELEKDGDRFSTRLVIEHCDAYSPEIPGEKRFLSLADEMKAARNAGLGIAVNWGRSAVEAQNNQRPSEHITSLTDAGLLEGLMFSGAGAEKNLYGSAWADAHLPLKTDEPTSLMDEEEVVRCLELAGSQPRYLGAKIQTPPQSSVKTRIEMISRILGLLG